MKQKPKFKKIQRLSGFFVLMRLTNLITKLIKRHRKRFQINKIRDEKGYITSDIEEI